MSKDSAEQQARNLLENVGVLDAQDWPSSRLVAIANLITEAAVADELLTIRDEFAKAALGLFSTVESMRVIGTVAQERGYQVSRAVAESTYEIADAMLEARKR